MEATFNHHGLSMAQFKDCLAGLGQANGVQQALLANMVRAAGGLARAWERDNERAKGPERKAEGERE